MRTMMLIGCMFAGILALSAQSAEEEVVRLKSETAPEQTTDQWRSGGIEETGEHPSADRLLPGSWDLSMGTTFSYMKGFGSGMGLYAMPVYTLPLNQKWSLHGGVVASGFTPLGTVGPVAELQTPSTYTSLAAFAAASYRMTDRLVLHGSGTKQLLSAPVTPLTPYRGDNFSLGATYKLGDNITIGATINVSEGYGHYFAPPVMGSPFGSPHSYPFGSGYIW